jgi:hypothetical protein
MNGPPNPGSSPFDNPVGQARNRAQSKIYEQLKRIPGLSDVRYEDSGTGIGLQARSDIDTTVFADGVIAYPEAYIQANWWPQPDDEPNWFQFHYTDSSGFDCGWHRQPNDHVNGLDHFQERDSSEEEYRYEPVTFEHRTATGLTWEIIDGLLVDVLLDRYG